MVTLESSKLFSRLPPAELAKLREIAKEMRFAAGQEIFKEGDPGNGAYLVRSGAIRISAVIGTGDRVVFSKVLPGDVFGEMSLLDNQPRSACASAETDSVVYFVPRDEMVAMLKRLPELSMSLVQEISQRLREFNRQYVREVLQAERMTLVGRFASSIVHDLKNPLTIIGIAAELACLDSSTAETRKMAQQRIFKQIDRITQLVNDILEFTRGSATLPTRAAVEYGSYVKSVIEEFQREVAAKSISIEYENQPPEIKLQLNPHRLTRVFYNLIFNAVDAMPDGGKITIRFCLTDTAVVTEVEDTGPGIAPEIAGRLFEPFATYGKTRGTGLGLSISKRIIEEHGGRISARNEPGGGAVFSFALPKPDSN
jgi:signal transduction histidine kinase